MIRGFAPPISANSLESDKRRDTALLLAAELDDRKVAVVRRLRCALSRLLLESEQVTGCAFGADRKRAACGSFSLRGNPYWRMEIRLQGFPHNLHPNPQRARKPTVCTAGTPHSSRQARHLPPLGKAKAYLCSDTKCKVLTVSMTLQELYSRDLTQPSPVGEGGPRQRWMRRSAPRQNGSSRRRPLPNGGNPLQIVGHHRNPCRANYASLV